MHTTFRLACALVIVFAAPRARAQTLSTALSKLESNVTTTRMEGFDEIFRLANVGFRPTASLRPGATHVASYAREHREVAPALISLLERENGAVRRGEGRDFGESYAVDYYGNLIGTVAALRDPRAVRALMGAIETGGMATEGLAAIGEPAAPEVLRAATSANRATRISALRALAEMVGGDAASGLSRRSREQIRSVLLTALHDKKVSARIMALRGIAYYGDDESRKIVAAVATHDAHAIQRDGRTVYPVRELAAATLKKQDSLRLQRR